VVRVVAVGVGVGVDDVGTDEEGETSGERVGLGAVSADGVEEQPTSRTPESTTVANRYRDVT
jgi:hypothetical protein